MNIIRLFVVFKNRVSRYLGEPRSPCWIYEVCLSLLYCTSIVFLLAVHDTVLLISVDPEQQLDATASSYRIACLMSQVSRRRHSALPLK